MGAWVHGGMGMGMGMGMGAWMRGCMGLARLRRSGDSLRPLPRVA